MTRRDLRTGLAVVAALGIFIAAMLVVGNIGPVRPELRRLTVADVVREASPAGRFGREEIRVVGWYAELAADCDVGEVSATGDVAWLARSCPLRVLLPEQPDQAVTQAELEGTGLRLAAPTGAAFPSRAEPGGPNLRMQQLVFVGRFDDPSAAACPSAIRQRCRDTFVVTDYDGLLR